MNLQQSQLISCRSSKRRWDSLNDKVYQFVLEHCFAVEVGDQERDIISLRTNRRLAFTPRTQHPIPQTHLDRFPPQNHKVLRPHRHEPRKLLAQDALNLIRLLDRDGYTDTVDTRFDEDALGFVSRDD